MRRCDRGIRLGEAILRNGRILNLARNHRQVAQKAPPSMRMTSCGNGLPGHKTPGRTCQMTLKEIPVAAIDSIITQGMVRIEPIATTTRMDHHGVSVGHAVIPTIDMTSPNTNTIEYCSNNQVSKMNQALQKRIRGVSEVLDSKTKMGILTHHSGTSLYRLIRRAPPSLNPV